jgi:pilus assembly protein CpaE
MYPITVGLIIGGKEFWDEVQLCLQNLPVRTVLEQSEIDDWPAFLAKLEHLSPDALLLEISVLKEEWEEALGKIKLRAPGCMVVALHTAADPETILSVIRAGADEYVYPPLTVNLTKALERLSARKVRTSTGVRTGGKICAFLSAKGGCGATTIACHTAVEITRQTNGEVLLADLDLDAGLVGFLMKSKSGYSVLDALNNTHRLDANYWKALVSNGMPRLGVIKAPGAQLVRNEPRPEDLRHVLQFVRFHYDWTILDLGRGFSPLVATALEEVDETFLVTTLDVPALHQVKQIVQAVTDAGLGRERLSLILNRVPKVPDVTPEELEKLLGVSVHSMLADDYASIYEAYAEGQLLPPGSTLGKQLTRLASRIAGLPERPRKKKFSLFGD